MAFAQNAPNVTTTMTLKTRKRKNSCKTVNIFVLERKASKMQSQACEKSCFEKQSKYFPTYYYSYNGIINSFEVILSQPGLPENVRDG